jgi:hypothetical protein
MIDIPELKRWIETLDPQGDVAVDEGGLTLLEIGKDGKPTGACLEVGGVPLGE